MGIVRGQKEGNMDASTLCWASKALGSLIDTIRADGTTTIYGRDEADVKREYPDAETMTVEAWCNWKAEQQRTPITWAATTQERFDYALNVLPPAAMLRGGFLLGEPCDHDAGNGLPRYAAFRQRGDVYEESNRPMTGLEFAGEMGGAAC